MDNLFVTYNLALLAKEKGFNEPCCNYKEHSKKKTRIELGYNSEWICWNTYKDYISIPLYQQIINWLRENHKIYITNDVYPYEDLIIYKLTFKDGYGIWSTKDFKSLNDVVKAGLELMPPIKK